MPTILHNKFLLITSLANSVHLRKRNSGTEMLLNIMIKGRKNTKNYNLLKKKTVTIQWTSSCLIAIIPISYFTTNYKFFVVV